MIWHDTKVQGCFLLEPRRFADQRGYFASIFNAEEFAGKGLDTAVAQSSISLNHATGTLRGMHYQAPPHAETKLVRCSRGAIFDVVVDLRTDSPTFLAWEGAELNEANSRCLYIPKGCAHGFITLKDGVEVAYQISYPYRPDAARGVRWDDPSIGIDWPLAPTVISDRDRDWPYLEAGRDPLA